LEHNPRLFDLIRIDHFRGLVSYWEVKAGKKTAVDGEWIKVPTERLSQHSFPTLSQPAHDSRGSGHRHPDVREIISSFGLYGMQLLLFAFGEGMPENPYVSHNHVKNCFVTRELTTITPQEAGLSMRPGLRTGSVFSSTWDVRSPPSRSPWSSSGWR
jgi:4-alpha-glucanotransferase